MQNNAKCFFKYIRVNHRAGTALIICFMVCVVFEICCAITPSELQTGNLVERLQMIYLEGATVAERYMEQSSVETY